MKATVDFQFLRWRLPPPWNAENLTYCLIFRMKRGILHLLLKYFEARQSSFDSYRPTKTIYHFFKWRLPPSRFPENYYMSKFFIAFLQLLVKSHYDLSMFTDEETLQKSVKSPFCRGRYTGRGIVTKYGTGPAADNFATYAKFDLNRSKGLVNIIGEQHGPRSTKHWQVGLHNNKN